MLLELGKTYVTRNGRQAKVVYIGADDSTKNAVIEVEGELKLYWDNGAFGNDHPLDIMPPVTYKLGQDIFDEDGDRWIVVSLKPPRAVMEAHLASTINSNDYFVGLYAYHIIDGYVGAHKIKA